MSRRTLRDKRRQVDVLDGYEWEHKTGACPHVRQHKPFSWWFVCFVVPFSCTAKYSTC